MVLKVVPVDDSLTTVAEDEVKVDAVGVEGCCALVEEIEEGFCDELLAPIVEAPLDARGVNNEFELPRLVLEAKVLPPNPSEPI